MLDAANWIVALISADHREDLHSAQHLSRHRLRQLCGQVRKMTPVGSSLPDHEYWLTVRLESRRHEGEPVSGRHHPYKWDRCVGEL